MKRQGTPASSPASSEKATETAASPTLVPKLRFPEFRAEPSWNQKALGTLGQFTRGLTYGADDVAPQGLLVLRSTNIQDGTLILHRDLVFVGKECPPTLRLRQGDIAICMSNGSKALVGKSAEYAGNYPADLTVGAFCSFFRPAVSFAKLAFQSKEYESYVGDLIAGGNINNLNNSVLEKFYFSIPPTEAEQQKIAECLSTLDELIGAESQKLDTLNAHKKGLVQQLFPREGETLPRLRFPEFHDAPEWSRKSLGAAATFYNGRAYKQEELLEIGKYRVLRVGNFFTSNSWYYSDLELEGTKYCDTGDLLYAWSASFGPRIWRGGKAIYHYHIWKVVERHDVDKAFLYILLENETEKMKAQSANGLGLLHITKGTIESWDAAFPGKAEQHRIASCLSSLDELIAAQRTLIDALKTHKQGLMQQLFPVPDID